MTLRLNNISFEIKKKSSTNLILENISFDVENNAFTVVIGPSGCGKSILMNIIAGYEEPSYGTITLNEKIIKNPNADRLLVFQESALFPWMTTLENIMYGPLVQCKENRDSIMVRARDILMRVGLSDFAEKYPMQLSGGMQRRCELARVLINNPALLLMDEPFRGLDHMSRELMQEYFLNLLEQRDEAVLFVTSEIDEAIFLGDRLIVLGGTPTKIIAFIDIDLPRPRERSKLLGSKQYLDVKKQVLDLLYKEVSTDRLSTL